MLITNQPDPTILLIRVQVNDPALATGCWAQFYSDRDFKGDMATLVGPAVIETVDKDSAKALKRAIDSISVGPKTTLQVYEHSMFRDRTATFAPNTRAGGLVQRLGFGGRIGVHEAIVHLLRRRQIRALRAPRRAADLRRQTFEVRLIYGGRARDFPQC